MATCLPSPRTPHDQLRILHFRCCTLTSGFKRAKWLQDKIAVRRTLHTLWPLSTAAKLNPQRHSIAVHVIMFLPPYGLVRNLVAHAKAAGCAALKLQHSVASRGIHLLRKHTIMATSDSRVNEVLDFWFGTCGEQFCKDTCLHSQTATQTTNSLCCHSDVVVVA